MKAPCKDCTKRHVSCHCDCEDYKQWKQEFADNKRMILANRKSEMDLYLYKNNIFILLLTIITYKYNKLKFKKLKYIF